MQFNACNMMYAICNVPTTTYHYYATTIVIISDVTMLGFVSLS